MSHEAIKQTVSKYYNNKLATHGATPKGVDWNTEASQNLRFQQLLTLVRESSASLTLLDYGCGYGSLLSYLRSQNNCISYTGYDIAGSMISEASKIHAKEVGASWTTALAPNAVFDYVVSSGVFNVKMEHSKNVWKEYMYESLNSFNQLSSRGFAFNALTSYSDSEYMRDDLYYSNPLELFDYCKRMFSKRVALLHHYPLYEFTIIVEKGY